MRRCVLALGCLLLSFVSSAALRSHSRSSSSSSEEHLQPPAVFPLMGAACHEAPPTAPKAPPSVIVEVEDTKTNTTLSFAIFITAEEEEGSGIDGRGRSDEKNSSRESDDISNEETRKQDIQPMASLPPSSRPMRNKYDEMKWSSEEMMGDQPMFTFSDEQIGGFSNTSSSSGNQKRTLSDHFTNTESDVKLSDDFNNSTESSEVHSPATVTDYSDDKNDITPDFTNDSNSEETAEPLFYDFNNSAELNNQPARTVFGPESQEETSSSSEKVNQDGVPLSRGSISKDFGFGSRLQEVFRSIQDAVDLLSGNQELTGAKVDFTLNTLTGSQTRFSLSSDESNEISESVSSNPKNQTSPDPDSDESLKATSHSFQQGTGPRDSAEQLTGPTTSPIPDLIKPDQDSKKVQEASGRSIQGNQGAFSDLVSPGQDVGRWNLNMPRDTVSQDSYRLVLQMNVSLNSDSSEESQESVVGSTPGLSGVGGPEVNSSSEEVLTDLSSSSTPGRVSSPVPSSQAPTESGSLSTEDLSDSAGLDSGSDPHHPHPNPTSSSDPNPDSGSDPGPELNHSPSLRKNFSSEVSQEESEETANISTDANSDISREANSTVDHRANSASIAASSAASMDANPDSSVKVAEAGTTDATDDVSIETDLTATTSLPSMHVSSAASTDANASNELSVEENGEASLEASAVSMKPTATTESRTNPPDSGASTDATANVEMQQAGADVRIEANADANSPKRHANSDESTAPPPPCRRRPYRFGFLGPISHSHGNRPVVREMASKEGVMLVRHHQKSTPQQNQQSVYLNSLYEDKQRDEDKQRRQQTAGRQSDRKPARVSAVAAAKSSSEETK